MYHKKTRLSMSLLSWGILTFSMLCFSCGEPEKKEETACTISTPECPAEQICQPLPDGKAFCRAQCAPDKADACEGTWVCALRTDGKHACHPPVLLKGKITDALTGQPIEGALIHAADNTGSSASDVVRSDKNGDYALPVPIKRKPDGTLAEGGVFTLRVSAAGYQRFPFGVRPALPIDITQGTQKDEGWTVENAATQVALLPLPDNLKKGGTIEGKVIATSANKNPGGVLIIAESTSGEGGAIGYSDRSGSFTLFNVPPGSWTLKGYKAGLQLTPAAITVEDAKTLEGVELKESSKPLSTVSGTISIVNAPGGSLTSVVLVPKAAFNKVFANGEVPAGLRAPQAPAAPSIAGAFSIANVPDGRYVVLAAFENDRLVRDPDPGISGTQLVEIDVPQGGSNQVTLPSSFKITEALQILSPGATKPEATSSTPTFSWKDDSSEDKYTLVVFNALGDEVWRNDSIPSGKGSKPVTVPYAGPPLKPGMIYQFRATSWRKGGPISTTEDLLGVFFVPRK